MTGKIILEVLLGFAVLILGFGFWSAGRGPAFMKKLLSDSQELEKIIKYIGEENLINDGKEVEPSFGSYENNVSLFLSLGIKGLDRTRNFMLIFVLVLLLSSFFLDSKFLIINICLFFLSAVGGVHSTVKNSIVTDIHSVMLNIYKWNAMNPENCKNFCVNEKPYLKNIYVLIEKIN